MLVILTVYIYLPSLFSYLSVAVGIKLYAMYVIIKCIQLAELLRKSSEHTLVDMVQLLFSRLPQFKEDPKWATNVRKVCAFTCDVLLGNTHHEP